MAVSGVVPQPKANLIIIGLVSSAQTFVIPRVGSFPLNIDGGDSIAVPIRFQPTTVEP